MNNREALQEFEDNAYHPSMKPNISGEAKVLAMCALRKEIMREVTDEFPKWVVCFSCINRRSPLCQKCTRNTFAPCGEKEDYHNFVKEKADELL